MNEPHAASPLGRMHARMQRRAEAAALELSPSSPSSPTPGSVARRRPIAAVSARSPATAEGPAVYRDAGPGAEAAYLSSGSTSAVAPAPSDGAGARGTAAPAPLVHAVRIRLSSTAAADDALKTVLLGGGPAAGVPHTGESAAERRVNSAVAPTVAAAPPRSRTTSDASAPPTSRTRSGSSTSGRARAALAAGETRRRSSSRASAESVSTARAVPRAGRAPSSAAPHQIGARHALGDAAPGALLAVAAAPTAAVPAAAALSTATYRSAATIPAVAAATSAAADWRAAATRPPVPRRPAGGGLAPSAASAAPSAEDAAATATGAAPLPAALMSRRTGSASAHEDDGEAALDNGYVGYGNGGSTSRHPSHQRGPIMAAAVSLRAMLQRPNLPPQLPRGTTAAAPLAATPDTDAILVDVDAASGLSRAPGAAAAAGGGRVEAGRAAVAAAVPPAASTGAANERRASAFVTGSRGDTRGDEAAAAAAPASPVPVVIDVASSNTRQQRGESAATASAAARESALGGGATLERALSLPLDAEPLQPRPRQASQPEVAAARSRPGTRGESFGSAYEAGAALPVAPPSSASSVSQPHGSSSQQPSSRTLDRRAVVAGYVAGNVGQGSDGRGGAFRGTTVQPPAPPPPGGAADGADALPAPPTAAPGSPLDEALAADVAAEAQRRALLRRPHLKPEALKRLEVGDEAYEARRAAKRLGKVITKEHVLYQTSFAMMLGIYTSVVSAAAGAADRGDAAAAATPALLAPAPPLPRPLPPLLLPPKLLLDDFMRVRKLVFPPRGSATTPPHRLPATFRFKDYAPRVFAQLRERWSVDSTHYLRSLGGAYEYIEFASNSKSGAFFFYSADGRFMIKTQSRGESKLLRRILAHYYGYAMANPGTYITRFYGMHRITLPHVRRKLHFVVMASVWAGDRPVHEMYDLKGSTVGRAASEEERRRGPAAAVFKDLDLVSSGTRIQLGPGRREAFLAQLSADAAFLASMHIMDYSLLLGVHHASMRGVAATHALAPPAAPAAAAAAASTEADAPAASAAAAAAAAAAAVAYASVSRAASSQVAVVGAGVGLMPDGDHHRGDGGGAGRLGPRDVRPHGQHQPTTGDVTALAAPTEVSATAARAEAAATQTGGYGSSAHPLDARGHVAAHDALLLQTAAAALRRHDVGSDARAAVRIDDDDGDDAGAPVPLSRAVPPHVPPPGDVAAAAAASALSIVSLPGSSGRAGSDSGMRGAPPVATTTTHDSGNGDVRVATEALDASEDDEALGSGDYDTGTTSDRGAAHAQQHRQHQRHARKDAGASELRRRGAAAPLHRRGTSSSHHHAEPLPEQPQHTGTIAGIAIGEHGQRVSGLPPGAREPPPEPSTAAGGGILGMLANGTPADETYFIGIIDVLQQYDLRKMGETALRSMLGQPPAGISAVAPRFYAERFVRFISEHTD